MVIILQQLTETMSVLRFNKSPCINDTMHNK